MNTNQLFERSKNIIIRPKNEWFKIEAERMPMAVVLKDYAIPLLLILSGIIFISGFLHHDFAYATVNAIVSLGVQVLAVYVSAYVLNELPKNFGGATTIDVCFNAVVFASIPSWIVTAIIAIAPALASIGPLALYAFYLFYLGLNILIAVPDDKRVGFNLIGILILFLTNSILGAAGHKILHAILSNGNFTF